MKTLDEIIQTLNHYKPMLEKQYRITKIGVFGSYRRGEETERSDVDILVEFDPAFRFGLLKFCELEDYLSDALNLNVDLVMKNALKPKIGQRILDEVIYV